MRRSFRSNTLTDDDNLSVYSMDDVRSNSWWHCSIA